ncbi:MAG: type 1 glutamine amidotransferase domain-containing protein [Sphingorhabdus sp.]
MAARCKILIPMPNLDFDPTEVCVPWKIMKAAGNDVVFATPDGSKGAADAIMLSGEGLDPWGFIPALRRIKLIGHFLRADKNARDCYQEMLGDERFNNPLPYSDLSADDYDGILLPGGHAKRIKPYLESRKLQDVIAGFFDSETANGGHKPVGAICHGVVLPARAVSKKTGKSPLYGKKTTGLTWAQERAAWQLTRYFARFWDPHYFRTYLEEPGEAAGYRSVEAEVKRALRDPEDFVEVDPAAPFYKIKTGIKRDNLSDERPAWVVKDGNYISARWPGDAHTFAKRYVDLLDEVYGGKA